MNRAGASARAKARQLTREHARRAAWWVAAGATGGGLLASPSGPGAIGTGAVLGGLGGAVGGLRGVRAVGQRWRQGAAGEARTGKLVRPLAREGWYLHHDLSIPHSRANIDHLFVVPSGTAVIVADTKAWHARNAKVRYVNGNLLYGRWAQDDKVNTIRWETDRASQALGVNAVSVMVIDGGFIDRGYHPGGWIQIDPKFYVVEQGMLLEVMRAVNFGRPNRAAAKRLSRQVVRNLPAYQRGAGS